MKRSRYEFDPQPDVELRLIRPNKQELLPANVSIELNLTAMSLSLEALKASNERIFTNNPVRQRSSLIWPQHENTKPTSSAAALDALSKSCGNEDPTLDPEPGEIRMMVSSRHLILASTYFRNMLTGSWKESVAGNEAISTVTANDWDEQALVIVMDIIHGHNREVPKHLELELLAKIAIIVDYYECHEAVEPFVDLWVDHLGKELPWYFGRECVLWICVSRIFPKEEIFESMTDLALKYSQGSIDAPALPCNQLLEKLNEKRIGLIEQALQILPDVCESLSDETDQCSFACSSMLLGALMKERQRLKHIRPPLTRPYETYSITKVIDMMSNIREPKWIPFEPFTSKRSMVPHRCTIREYINEPLEQLKAQVQGFKLSDVK